MPAQHKQPLIKKGPYHDVQTFNDLSEEQVCREWLWLRAVVRKHRPHRSVVDCQIAARLLDACRTPSGTGQVDIANLQHDIGVPRDKVAASLQRLADNGAIAAIEPNSYAVNFDWANDWVSYKTNPPSSAARTRVILGWELSA
jgi:hypothetical protein